MTKGLNTIAAEAGELKATISQLATALTNNEQAHTRLAADMEAAQTKLKALQEASVAAFDELAAIAERRAESVPGRNVGGQFVACICGAPDGALIQDHVESCAVYAATVALAATAPNCQAASF